MVALCGHCRSNLRLSSKTSRLKPKSYSLVGEEEVEEMVLGNEFLVVLVELQMVLLEAFLMELEIGQES
ncbi:hypothetical protein ACLOJK_016188 [Asimina triloba]